jgi:hypothetical protein
MAGSGAYGQLEEFDDYRSTSGYSKVANESLELLLYTHCAHCSGDLRCPLIG